MAVSTIKRVRPFAFNSSAYSLFTQIHCCLYRLTGYATGNGSGTAGTPATASREDLPTAGGGTPATLNPEDSTAAGVARLPIVKPNISQTNQQHCYTKADEHKFEHDGFG